MYKCICAYTNCKGHSALCKHTHAHKETQQSRSPPLFPPSDCRGHCNSTVGAKFNSKAVIKNERLQAMALPRAFVFYDQLCSRHCRGAAALLVKGETSDGWVGIWFIRAGGRAGERRGLSCVNLFALESKVSKSSSFASAVSPKVCWSELTVSL